MLCNYSLESATVLYTTASIPSLSRKEILQLMDMARSQVPEGSLRLCLHPHVNVQLHEMVIVHSQETIVPLHRHIDKDESIFVYEGSMDVLFYDDKCEEVYRIECGNYASGKICQLRIPVYQWHTMRITSPQVCFAEVTTGPFIPSAMETASLRH